MSDASRKQKFQSTPPRRRRRQRPESGPRWLRVSIHAPAKEATPAAASNKKPWEFQSTPPRRRRPIVRSTGSVYGMFQSTPPRRRRRDRIAKLYTEHRVSIHAPAKEATPALPLSRRETNVSIHAPAKEATSSASSSSFDWLFQSTPPRRRRRAKGIVATLEIDGFNPRPREGGDPDTMAVVVSCTGFNPRPREGGDSTAKLS